MVHVFKITKGKVTVKIDDLKLLRSKVTEKIVTPEYFWAFERRAKGSATGLSWYSGSRLPAEV